MRLERKRLIFTSENLFGYQKTVFKTRMGIIVVGLGALLWLVGCALPNELQKSKLPATLLVSLGYGETVRSDIVRISRVSEGWRGLRRQLEFEIENRQLSPLVVDLEVIFWDASGRKIENPWASQPLRLKPAGVRVVRVTAPSMDAAVYTIRLLRHGTVHPGRASTPEDQVGETR